MAELFSGEVCYEEVSVDILSKLPLHFFELIKQKKWQERERALKALNNLLPPTTTATRLAPGDYTEVCLVLKEVICKDANVMIVALATRCLAGLARGLESQFQNLGKLCLATVLEKLKVNNVKVASELHNALDAMYPCLGIEDIQEDCLEALQNKNPTVCLQTTRFLIRALGECSKDFFANKKSVIERYEIGLQPLLYHRESLVREAAREALHVLVELKPPRIRIFSSGREKIRAKIKDSGVDKVDDTNPQSSLYSVRSLKNQRFADEASNKTLSWKFATTRPEFVNQLKDQMEKSGFDRTILSKMFHTDAKQQWKAIMILEAHISKDLDGLKANLDLIIKWTSTLVDPIAELLVANYLNAAFSALSNSPYQLHYYEAIALIPFLVKMRNSQLVRPILRSLNKLYPAEDLGILLIEQIGMRDNQCDVLAAIINNGGVSNNKDCPEARVSPSEDETVASS